ncbi:HEPN domain-containing protein [Sinanaerobacter chloroacetimidivorans]|uniref:HEPN domain-containing protein n=1 Tax=Sinanaerobacter chloroacetimidivorans TaxID=2818044 RepID=A0A8J8B0C3_9FIRM|nr:HEPN domain-containing protein [Sinanaerobacter chloroacetimidivorans]
MVRKDCAYLNQYYIEARYPADTPLTVTEQDVEKCMNIARRVMTTCCCPLGNISE